MSIGILYESKEWSSYYLEKCISDMGLTARLIDMQGEIDEGELLSYKLIANRMPGSAGFRGHQKSLDRTPAVIELLKNNGVPMINTYETHFYETSKELSTKTLAARGFPVPAVYCVCHPAQMAENTEIEYPCIVKPDCGGRTNCTFIVGSRKELGEIMKNVPNIKFIAEEYIVPELGFLTRVEVIGRSCRSVLKKGIAENGLAAYHLGSVFEAYPEVGAKVKNSAVDIMDMLKIEAGSMDIIENNSGFYVIDINSVSNASEDNIETFKFDLIKETAEYIVGKYKKLCL